MNDQTVSVNLPEHSYPIYIGYEILSHRDIFAPHIHGQQVLIVTQENIAKHYLSFLQKTLRSYQCDVCYLPDGEQYKNLQEWEKIFDVLLQYAHDRSTTLIALGGGVVGDMTGFAAACYQRGVNYIQVPTSLIAQVDSAIGGKTGVNHMRGKNMVGAFYQPQCVITDVSLLQSLPHREFISGFAEVIKYGLIQDADFFLWLENNIIACLNRDEYALLQIVSRSVEIKAGIVSQDEKDIGLRNILNFGHTVGHALETACGYQDILHGEAVAIGMVIAAELSAIYQFISASDVKRIVSLLNICGLLQNPMEYPSPSILLDLIKLDKKVINKKVQFILLKKIGQAVKVSDVSEKQIIKAIKKSRE